MSSTPTPTAPPPPPRNLLSWLRVFGPGAIVASLTIGTGELVFSTRGGAIFGYEILFLFIVISLLKWALVVSAARHFILTGVHPYRRMLDLPGPRGWLPMVLSLIALVCVPIWIAFLPGMLGNFISSLTGTDAKSGGSAALQFVWGAIVLAGLLTLIATTGYSVLERVQLVLVTTMLVCATVALVLQNPEWSELLRGAFVPQKLTYPNWLAGSYPEIAKDSPWVETTRYVGIIGGASFDYMAYSTWLREKRWGRAGGEPATEADLAASAQDPNDLARRWTKAASVDCALSFLLVVGFSAVFVASGVLLGQEQKVPASDGFLIHQANFLAEIHPSLYSVFVAGAFLTILGSIYGTIEVGCAISKEMIHTWRPEFESRNRVKLRRWTVVWCALGAFSILTWQALHQLGSEPDAGNPPLLLAILTPANLFTGVLGCGIVCAVNCWMDRKFLPRELRMGRALLILNLIAAPIFLVLGLKGYWEHSSRLYALTSLAVLIVAGVGIASVVERRTRRGDRAG